ncbi:putative membrane protein [Clostridium bornimense]|uniref:Putative membrane protein n=1 Tax=Clostridium bornimense TaxID=1216932 RepID=W6SJN8_9CLOT|nr:hypothetical protein [Clostridium bornimense]CDM69915.1 putative membrane protein [Clostridium bornimense]
MFISDIRKKFLKTIVIFVISTIFAFIFNKVYGIFGHGVTSPYMTYMFLYPLVGGVLFYGIIMLFIPSIVNKKKYRFFYNIYNSGIAILTVGSLLRGVMEIAGTSSFYLMVYTLIGWLCIIISISVLIIE